MRRSRKKQVPSRVAVVVLFLLEATLVMGCAGRYYRTLPSEGEILNLAPLGEVYGQLPITEVVATSELLADQKLHLALEEVGHGSRDRMVVMVHGLLSDRTIWRYVQAKLGQDQRVLLVDLLGCGESDKPDPKTLGPEGYSPSAQARHVLQALRTHFERTGAPNRLVFVGHSSSSEGSGSISDHVNALSSLAFSPDGSTLVGLTLGGRLRVWNSQLATEVR